MHASARAQTQPEKCTQFAIPTLKVKQSVTAYIQTEAYTHTLRNTRISLTNFGKPSLKQTHFCILTVSRLHLVPVGSVGFGKTCSPFVISRKVR